MTPDLRAAARRAAAFLAAWDEHHTTRDQVLVQVKPGSSDMLTSDDLRALLAAIEPEDESPADLDAQATLILARNRLAASCGCADPHCRRRLTESTQRLAALLGIIPDPAEQPIGHIPTPRGINYLRNRQQQHPREADR